MKIIFNTIFFVYHAIFVSSNASCRFTPTCSQFFLDATEKYGSTKGFIMSCKRILSCHPFTKRSFYDPA